MTSDTLKESLEITSFVFKTTCGELEIVGQSTAHAISSTRPDSKGTLPKRE